VTKAHNLSDFKHAWLSPHEANPQVKRKKCASDPHIDIAVGEELLQILAVLCVHLPNRHYHYWRSGDKTWPIVMGTSAAGGPGRSPPRLPLAKPLEYTRRHVPFSCSSVLLCPLPFSSAGHQQPQLWKLVLKGQEGLSAPGCSHPPHMIQGPKNIWHLESKTMILCWPVCDACL
jgi:hypothetical protein